MQNQEIVAHLHRLNRPMLARYWERWAEAPLIDYAKTLWEPPARQVPLEPELERALWKVGRQQGWSAARCARVWSQLKEQRIVQTATHVTPTEGPTFLGIHRLSLVGKPPEADYLVAAYSGVPFSNAAWSGALSYGAVTQLSDVLDPKNTHFREAQRAEIDRRRDGADLRLSLIPSSWRDGLVYRAEIPQRSHELSPSLCPRSQEIFPDFQDYQDYSSWALRSSEQQLQRLFPEQQIHYWDVNEWITAYLLEVLPQADHWLTRLLFDKDKPAGGPSIFEAPWFVTEILHKQKRKVENLTPRDAALRGQTVTLPLNPETLSEALQNQRLCPALLPTFLVLRFANGLRCWGSFEQIEYLDELRARLEHLDHFSEKHTQRDETPTLTTGRVLTKTGEPVYPLDVCLENQTLPALPTTLGEWWQPLLAKLKPRNARF